MSFNEQIIKEINNIHQLTQNLDINKLNDDKINIDHIINSVQLQIYNVNNLKCKLNESLQNLKKIKQLKCDHQYEYDNVNYDSMQLVCINCNKLFI